MAGFRRVPYLERVVSGSPARTNFVLRTPQAHAKRSNMRASTTVYVSWGKGAKARLRFTRSGAPNIEAAYSTHYLLPKTAAPKLVRGAQEGGLPAE